MIPVPTRKNVLDGAYRNMESPCEFWNWHPHSLFESDECFPHKSYLSNISIGEFRHWVFFPFKGAAKASSRGVNHVVSMSGVLKILYAVIGFISISVINLFSYGAWSNKGQGNKCVNTKLSTSFPIVKDNASVAIAVQVPIEKSLGDARNYNSPAMAVGIVTSDLAKIRYIIESLISNNRLPDFGGIIFGGHVKSSRDFSCQEPLSRSSALCGSFSLA